MSNLLERLQAALADCYAVESEIGRGGMATVYLTEDLKHHRKALAAVEVLETRAQRMYVKPMIVVSLYDLAGDIDGAIEWLKRAYVERDHDMVYLAVAPHSPALRADPRFQDLLRRMNLPR